MSCSAEDTEVGSAAGGDESLSCLGRLAVAFRFGDVRGFVDNGVQAFCLSLTMVINCKTDCSKDRNFDNVSKIGIVFIVIGKFILVSIDTTLTST